MQYTFPRRSTPVHGTLDELSDAQLIDESQGGRADLAGLALALADARRLRVEIPEATWDTLVAHAERYESLQAELARRGI